VRDFESGFCAYTNVQQGDQFDWERGSGITPSFYTGPNNDHTTNSAQGNLSIPEMITTNSGIDKLPCAEFVV
jgi:hypothetical protein